MASKQARRTLYRATVAKDLLLVRELIVQPELRGISGRMKSLYRAVKDDQLEIVQALVSDQPITEEEEHREDDNYTLSNLYHPILVKSLAKSNPGFWVAVRPYVIGSFDSSDLKQCSIQMLHHFDTCDQIAIRGWVDLLRDCTEMSRFQAIWEVRFPSDRDLVDTDRELIRRLACVMVNYRELLPMAVAKMDYICQVYPGVVSDQEDVFLKIVFIIDHETNYGDHPEMVAWLFQSKCVDLRPWLTKMLLQIVEQGSCTGCPELLMAETRFYPARYLHDFGARIGLLVSRDPPIKLGWTSFLITGHYFYSPDIHLDLLARKLVAGCNYGLAAPDINSEELAYPEEEHLVEIAYGLDYGELVTIPAPSFLLDWYRDSGIGTKGARSQVTEC